MLDDQCVAARLAHRADPRLHTAPLRQRGVEHLHEGTPHIAHDPLVEDVAQELPVPFGRDGPFGQPRPFAVRRNDQRTVETLHIDDMFDGRQELHVFAVHLVAEEAVDLPAAPLAEAVHNAQRIVLHAAVPEHRNRLHHPLEGRLAALRHTKGVVDLLRSVERDAHQKVVPCEEVAPRLVDQRAVGLQRVLDPLAVGIFLLQLHRFPVEFEAQQQRFAAVPAELHGIHLVGFDILADVAFEQFVAHHGLPASVLHGLVQIVTVVAVEVAGRAGGFEHRREGHGTHLLLGVPKGKDILVFHRKIAFG